MVSWLEGGLWSLLRCLGPIGIGALILEKFIPRELCLMTFDSVVHLGRF